MLPLLVAAAAFAQDHPACPDGPLFDTAPMAQEDFVGFRPLGWISPLQHVFPAKHSAFTISLPGEAPKVKPVYFPGNAWVTRVGLLEVLNAGGEVEKTSYTLYFNPCREFTAYLNHLSSVPPRFAELVRKDRCNSYVTNGTRVNNCQAEVSVPVFSGELAGYSGDAAGVDFGATDFRIEPLGFARPDHYMREMLHYVSPVSYFTADSKQALESRLASYDGSQARTAEPRTGAYMQDLPGTAQGNWFVPEINLSIPLQQPDPFLALVHDYIDPAEPIFSVGTSVPGLKPGVYRFTPEPGGTINRDFSEITADGKTYCFDRFGIPGVQSKTKGGIPTSIPNGVLILTLPTPETLVIERIGAQGSTCESVGEWTFSSAAARFER